jgi:hypothetical protein
MPDFGRTQPITNPGCGFPPGHRIRKFLRSSGADGQTEVSQTDWRVGDGRACKVLERDRPERPSDGVAHDSARAGNGLGCVDKLNPDADTCKQHESGEALDQLVVTGGEAA